MPVSSCWRSSLLLPALWLAQSASAQFSVVAAVEAAGGSRLHNACTVSAAASVRLSFSAAVDPATIDAGSVRMFGRWSGPVELAMSFGPFGDEVVLVPQRPLFAGEAVTLQVSSAVAATSGAPLAGGFMTHWWAASLPSSGILSLDQVHDFRQPGEAAIRTYGVYAGDLDRDGSPDMTAVNEFASDVRSMSNDGCGNFGPLVQSPLPAASQPSASEGADFDGDGWIDLCVGNLVSQSVGVYRNDGAGGYLPPQILPISGACFGLAVLDADSDGDTDIVAANFTNVVLLRNNGDATFQAPVFFDAGGFGERNVAVADANGDGRPDIICGLASGPAVSVLLGDGTGSFTLSHTEPIASLPWQLAVGDVSGDGFVDCVVVESATGTAKVLFGNGQGKLRAPTSYPVGQQPISVDIGDLDGDGDLDIVTTSFAQAFGVVLRNDGTGRFSNAATLPVGAAGSCAVVVDYDRDGDNDVILIDELDDRAFVYRQAGPDPTAVQSPTCFASLRVNSFGGSGGFGSLGPTTVDAGALAFFELSGQPFEVFALFGGSQQAFGTPSPFGLLNIAPPFVTFGLGMLDAFGEARLTTPVPPGLQPGMLVLQGLVVTSGGALATNPEVVAF